MNNDTSPNAHAPVALIVEDEPQIRRFVRMALEGEGWQVHQSETLKRGLIDAGTRTPDLIILDLGLPDGDGITLIRDVRSWSPVPIIVLSARTDEGDKIGALDAGADDYLTKPFGIGELLARVRAALRRQHKGIAEASSKVVFGKVEVDLHKRQVMRDGQAVHLTPTEYKLLTVLLANMGRVVTAPQLLREVWGPSNSDNGHYVRIYMGHLRQKLEDDPAQPRHLLTETAVGYRLQA
jgi:two-component system, OmpR family, KDP operon response regulator KdpE